MAIKIDFVVDGLIPKTTRSQFRLMKQREFFNVAAWWHAAVRPGHFTTAGARKYNYRRRVTKNVRTGQRIKKYKDMVSGAPLVWTGDTFRRSKQRNIKATGTGSVVTMPLGVNRYRPPGWPSGQIRREIVRVLPSEEREVAKQIERGLRDNFRRKKRNINVNTFRRTS